MSRGGRGGRGGFRGGGRAGGPDFPLELDGDIEDIMAHQRRANAENDDDWLKTLYPPMPPPRRPSPTPEERRNVAAYRELRSLRRSGPFFIDAPVTGKRDPAEFNAFEDAATYANKKIKRARGMPNLKKVPVVLDLLPKELWSVFTDGDGNGGDGANSSDQKDVNFLKKRRLDRLAQFDEGAEGDAAADDDEDDNVDNEDGEEGAEAPEDDEFSETDNDEGDDYNAEKYFDNDEHADDDGDDGGGDDAW